MKKELNGIDKNTVVHSPTEELAKQVLQIAHDAGYTWDSGRSYLYHNYWNIQKDTTCYYLYDGEYYDIEYYQQRGFKILPATEFIEMNRSQPSDNDTPQQQITKSQETIGLRVRTEYGNGTVIGIVEGTCPYLVKLDNFNKGHSGRASVFIFGKPDDPYTTSCRFFNPENLTPIEPKFNLDTYTPKGQLEGFPKEVIKRMLECQVEQGNKEDVSVFEKTIRALKSKGGFDWHNTKEGANFWGNVIDYRDFNRFFEKYPKQAKTYTVTREALYEIHSRVCNNWKTNIEDLLREHRFKTEIEVPTDLLKQAWEEANEEHKEWLTKNGLVLPKQKVTKTVERWVNVYPNERVHGGLYETKELADKFSSLGRLDCVKITIPYEVEE